MNEIREIVREEIARIFEASEMEEKWSKDYKRSIDCSHPKGFSQKAHSAARKKRQKGEKTKSKSPFK